MEREEKCFVLQDAPGTWVQGCPKSLCSRRAPSPSPSPASTTGQESVGAGIPRGFMARKPWGAKALLGQPGGCLADHSLPNTPPSEQEEVKLHTELI